MSARAVLTIVLSALVCLALMGRPSLRDAAVDGATRDAHAAAVPATQQPTVPAAPQTTAATPQPSAPRPAALLPLYAAFVTLQALDIHSTLRAPRFGAREANPVVGGMLGSPAAFVAAKAGVSAGVVLVSERLWKRNRAASIVTMA